MDATVIGALVSAAVIPLGAAGWKGVAGLLEYRRQRLDAEAKEREQVRTLRSQERKEDREERAHERQADRDAMIKAVETVRDGLREAISKLEEQHRDQHREVLAEIRALDCAEKAHEEAA